ncbi:hypothetical protein BH11MYX2_BH11MYX2_26600 [soil metagenome]
MAPKKSAKPVKKPAAKKAKPASVVKKPKKATPKKAAPKKAAPKRVAPKRAAPAPAHTASLEVEQLGSITVPSGKLAIFDIGLVGFMPRDTLEPTIVKCDVPSDRPLAISGTRVGRGRFAECWDYVSIDLRTGSAAAARPASAGLAIDLAPGDVYNTKKLGEAAVDFARLVCMDHAALDTWKHDDSLDGLADVVFWGRDEALLAKTLRANRMQDGYGWKDIPIEDAEIKVFECEIQKAENNWLLAIDFRPHSHHFQVLAAARANPLGAGTLELAGTQMMLMFTSWGDGVFPIYLDLDAQDKPVRVRIQLATADSNAAMTAVNS